MLLNRKYMNIFDIIAIIILVLAVFAGYRKGFISQLFSFAGVVGGILLAIAFGADVGAFLGLDAAYSSVVGFAITFLATAIAASGVARLLARLFSALGLGSIDTLLGILLSVLKYALVLSVVFVSLERLNKKAGLIDSRHFAASKSFRPISAFSGTALDWFNAFAEEVKNDD